MPARSTGVRMLPNAVALTYIPSDLFSSALYPFWPICVCILLTYTTYIPPVYVYTYILDISYVYTIQKYIRIYCTEVYTYILLICITYAIMVLPWPGVWIYGMCVSGMGCVSEVWDVCLMYVVCVICV